MYWSARASSDRLSAVFLSVQQHNATGDHHHTAVMWIFVLPLLLLLLFCTPSSPLLHRTSFSISAFSFLFLFLFSSTSSSSFQLSSSSLCVSSRARSGRQQITEQKNIAKIGWHLRDKDSQLASGHQPSQQSSSARNEPSSHHLYVQSHHILKLPYGILSSQCFLHAKL